MIAPWYIIGVLFVWVGVGRNYVVQDWCIIGLGWVCRSGRIQLDVGLWCRLVVGVVSFVRGRLESVGVGVVLGVARQF